MVFDIRTINLYDIFILVSKGESGLLCNKQSLYPFENVFELIITYMKIFVDSFQKTVLTNTISITSAHVYTNLHCHCAYRHHDCHHQHASSQLRFDF